jgi:hypothetical protein
MAKDCQGRLLIVVVAAAAAAVDHDGGLKA